ncbi:Nucleolar GTP-binding protein 2 [Astathelohania contejeani]|uniref:Nucleolar GTP-binding protein 2 n=1 Tax=Astathelohania contejeani TaxID=164912 RepID=A0ABQ7I0I9_9MICR|nr:Nucleolar GTP-binding protein 2 [Thelohania contejeani]
MKENFYHDKQKVKFLNMLSSGKPKRNAHGNIIRDAEFQKRTCDPVSRIEPGRKWFQGTRTISQSDLELMRNTVATTTPYKVLLNHGKVPFSLLGDGREIKKQKRHEHSKIFGKGKIRTKPNLDYESIEELAKKVIEEKTGVSETKQRKNNYAIKGQSQRIWNELYKVLDSSDVIIHVLDARDPIGTKCECINEYVKNEAKHKHIIYILNKVDLVPTGVTAKWLKVLSREHPTLAYHSSSLNNFYGRINLINLLRQYSNLHKNKKQISVGFIGYPNVGKSSIINTLRNKNVCRVAPVPGETKVWQYITLMKRIFLIDCPGVVPAASEEEAVLRGAVRIENLESPEDYIPHIISKAKESVEKTYGIPISSCEDFLKALAIKYGKLLKDGEPNIDTVAKIVLHDWLKGKIEYYTLPEQV